MYPDPLPILPITRPVHGEVSVPGSKSLTNRALLLAALCRQPIVLNGALFSEDTHLMVEALRQLGWTLQADPRSRSVRIDGYNKPVSPGERIDLFVGLAGTAARFLTALCASETSGHFRLDGVEQMRKRPMKGLIDALRSLGAEILCAGEEDHFPIEIRGRGLRGGTVKIDASESSQLLSALLMVAPRASAPLEIELVGSIRWPFVQMTAELMHDFGQPAPVRTSETHFRLESGHAYRLKSGTYAIEPDATAASYFLALPLVAGGELKLLHLRGAGAGLQGDTAFQNVLASVGARISSVADGVAVSYNLGQPRVGVTENFREFSDTFLTLAALAPLLRGPTRISGIAHTRKQETDRVAGMSRELVRLGQEVHETEDSLEILPKPLRSGQTIETYGDHRFAMSFGILGCHDLHQNGESWLSIANPGCCAKTFPEFFDLLNQVRMRSVGS